MHANTKREDRGLCPCGVIERKCIGTEEVLVQNTHSTIQHCVSSGELSCIKTDTPPRNIVMYH